MLRQQYYSSTVRVLSHAVSVTRCFEEKSPNLLPQKQAHKTDLAILGKKIVAKSLQKLQKWRKIATSGRTAQTAERVTRDRKVPRSIPRNL